MTRKSSKSKATLETKNKSTPDTRTKSIDENLSYAKEDKMLEKVEKYVNKNRETTSKEMIERRGKRPKKEYQKWDLEVMISRISSESKPKEKAKEISKIAVYLIYTIIFIAIIIFIIKYFFVWVASQIS